MQKHLQKQRQIKKAILMPLGSAYPLKQVTQSVPCVALCLA